MFTVYVLRDPRNNKVRYVGFTSQSLDKRLKSHIEDRSKSNHRACWIRKLHNIGMRPIIQKISSFATRQEALDDEIRKIKLFRDLGFNLVNGTDGGEGTKNVTFSDDELRRRASWMKEFSSGRPKSDEQKLKLSKARKGVSNSSLNKPVKDSLGNVFESLKEAAIFHGIHYTNISAVVRGIRPHTKGIKFEYVNP